MLDLDGRRFCGPGQHILVRHIRGTQERIAVVKRHRDDFLSFVPFSRSDTISEFLRAAVRNLKRSEKRLLVVISMPSCWNGTLASRAAGYFGGECRPGIRKEQAGRRLCCGLRERNTQTPRNIAGGQAEALQRRSATKRVLRSWVRRIQSLGPAIQLAMSEATRTRRSITEHWLICSFAPRFGGSSAVIGTQCCAGWASHFGRAK
jgi:hypothetical protein